MKVKQCMLCKHLLISNLYTYFSACILQHFSRSLFIFRTHGNFNSKEVGEELAQSLLTLFDPTLDAMLLDTETPREQHLLIPIYTKPKTVSAMLPGETTSMLEKIQRTIGLICITALFDSRAKLSRNQKRIKITVNK